MNTHKNARLAYAGRVRLIERVLHDREEVRRVAVGIGMSRRTVYKWLARYRAEGYAGLCDRSSRPHRSPRRLPGRTAQRIKRLRRRRWTSPRIAHHLGLPISTVVVTVRRLGLARLSCLEPRPPVRRYQRERPGELLHIDAKKLARILPPRRGPALSPRARAVRGPRSGGGWEYLHVAVDDATRVAYLELLPNERGTTATQFLERALTWFTAHGVRVERVMTDNALAYRARCYQAVLRRHTIRHVRIRPYRPQTNGKAERFILTAIREWAYTRAYRSSAHRSGALPRFMQYYNTERPHMALGSIPPLSRLAAMNNVRVNDS